MKSQVAAPPQLLSEPTLRLPEGREKFLELLADADVLIHTYRPGALEHLGVGAEVRAVANPGIVEVTLNAYGWTGPWRERRGFDTVVQFSTGIANKTTQWALEQPGTRTPIIALQQQASADRPRHMPVETLDFSTGYQAAAAALRGLTRRLTRGVGSVSRLSLARTAALLIENQPDQTEPTFSLPLSAPLEDRVYNSAHGPVRRLEFPVRISNNPLFWERLPEAAGSSTPAWATQRPK